MRRIEICDLSLDEPLSIQAQTQVSGGLSLCQPGWGLNDYVANGFTAGAIAGGVVGFLGGSFPGLAIGVGLGGAGGAMGGGIVHYMCQ
jgi:hypothetical protein